MTTRLRLICHASTGAVRTAAFPDDEPLDDIGRRKLAALPVMARPDRAWTSPALRARQTAAALGLEAGIEPELRECDFGRWAGLSFAEVQANDPEGLAEWLAEPGATPHGGESLLALMSRVAAWLDAQQGEPGMVTAVTHASVVRAATVHAIGAPPASFWRIDVAPLSMAMLSRMGAQWTLASISPAPAGATPA